MTSVPIGFYEKETFYIEATVMGGEFDIIVEEYK